MVSTAIILAGGLGTRLQSVVKDVPKSMADIAGKPFLEYQLNYLEQQKIKHIIFSVGYKYEPIQNYFGNRFKGLQINYALEKEPLGTGGAVMNALNQCKEDSVFIVNGDTFFPISLEDLFYKHCEKKSAVSLALKEMQNFDRYGIVNINSDNAVTGFEEKRFREQGLINGGIYLADVNVLKSLTLPEKFSLEKDLFEKQVNKVSLYGFPFTQYFIDIGIPEDYAWAQHEIFLTQINLSWTLFLDRDGVINKKIDNGYVRTWKEFEFLPGAIEALKTLSSKFGKIIVVTNQQGIGKQLLSEDGLQSIHRNMINEIEKAGGRIDKIYFAPNLKSENSEFRKPGIGMALLAKKNNPEIDFSKSIMAGDSLHDMEFGKNAGMKTVFISPDNIQSPLVDLHADSLKSFAGLLS